MEARELTTLEKMTAEFFEKVEDQIEDGGSAAEFTMTLAKFLAHFHNRHYPPSLHGYMTQSFADAVTKMATALREVLPYDESMHLILVHEPVTSR
ncbi:hypothetical protein J19TS2_31250 [Cohnella xylanilytica]|uniref:hypothetical protein n=1 Tax=Cohnella xylanilytica TaxID=557555 RepID=UPI001B1AE750|nr:hypothetical protein [Cohnella xylanilytica]GIO13570.1 hypothetical protein J19TS2_31250 [Cohnella xylanilytica]